MKGLTFVMLLGIIFFTRCKTDPDPTGGSAVNEDITDPTTTYKIGGTFLSLSDVHIAHDNSGNTTYGQDTGDLLWERTKSKLREIIKTEHPKFLVYLGDLPAHYGDRDTNIKFMLKNLRSLDTNTQKIPILYLPGNNDALSYDYHSFTDAQGKTPFSEDPDIDDPWPILHETGTATSVTNLDFHKQFGFYSVDIIIGSDRLHVIALNTVIFCREGGNHYVGDDGFDQQQAAQKQFQWFKDKLDSYGLNDRIMIMMHIPPGIDGYSGDTLWNANLTFQDTTTGEYVLIQNAFLQAIKKHQPQIAGILTSHTHLDGLRRLYADQMATDLVAVSISTPGITPLHYNNPGFKLFIYQESTFDLLDFKTYYAAPTQPPQSNSTKSNGTFKFFSNSFYTFQEIYGKNNQPGTIFSTIQNMPDASEIKQKMEQVLYVKSNSPDASFKYLEALDVRPLQ